MTPNQKMIEDLLSLGESALRHLMGKRHDFKMPLREKLDDLVERLDLVRHEEFDVVLAMIAKARAMQEGLNDRLNLIEAKLNLSRTKAAPKKPKKRLRSVKQPAARKKRK